MGHFHLEAQPISGQEPWVALLRYRCLYHRLVKRSHANLRSNPSEILSRVRTIPINPIFEEAQSHLRQRG
jgi:hypothetical protein